MEIKKRSQLVSIKSVQTEKYLALNGLSILYLFSQVSGIIEEEGAERVQKVKIVDDHRGAVFT